jgi:hypothetical protein
MNNSLAEIERSGQVLIDHYQCPEEFVQVGTYGELSEKAGFFRFGGEATCFGRSSEFTPSPDPAQIVDDAADYVMGDQTGVKLPVDLAEIVLALRHERYLPHQNGKSITKSFRSLIREGYYTIRPAMPVSLRKHLQRYSLHNWDKREFPRWPVDSSVESAIESALRLNLKAQGVKEMPFIWFWPEGARACALMTHDVETVAGRDFCDRLMDIDDSYGIKSSFQVVPECRYPVPESYLGNIRQRGFEVNVHDLNHDGNLFKDYVEFKRRAVAIDRYRELFGARGFRSGVLYRNIDWFDLLHFEYDMSVPNVAHLDPQHGGCCTTFPYFIGDMLEIPVTATQDYTLFHILRNYSLNLWEKQTRLILKKHGVMSFIVHPDYVIGEREQEVYKNLLRHLSELREAAGLWIALPGELNEWWRQRNQLRLVKNDGGWEMVGGGKERARIAYARLENDELVYSL